VGYVDSDFAGCKNTRQSTKGNIFVVAGGPVSWETKRQDTVALLTVEAEFMAFSRVTIQALWLLKYFEEIGLPVIRPITIHADNNRAIAISTNDKNHCRTKHIDVWHHFVKECTEADEVNFKYILCYDSSWTGLLTSGDSGCHRWTAVGVRVIPLGRCNNNRTTWEQSCQGRDIDTQQMDA